MEVGSPSRSRSRSASRERKEERAREKWRDSASTRRVRCPRPCLLVCLVACLFISYKERPDRSKVQIKGPTTPCGPASPDLLAGSRGAVCCASAGGPVPDKPCSRPISAAGKSVQKLPDC